MFIYEELYELRASFVKRHGNVARHEALKGHFCKARATVLVILISHNSYGIQWLIT